MRLKPDLFGKKKSQFAAQKEHHIRKKNLIQNQSLKTGENQSLKVKCQLHKIAPTSHFFFFFARSLSLIFIEKGASRTPRTL